MDKKTTFFVLVLVMISILLLVGCRAEPEANVDIRGTISTLTSGGNGLGVILVEGELEEDTTYDKASITITKKTKIYRIENNKKVTANFAALAEGQEVEASFTGPVRESYPVQADAAQILILQ